VTTNGGSPALEVLPEADTNVMVEEVAAGDPPASTGPTWGVFPSTVAADNDVALVEPGVIMGHPMLRAPRDVSLDEAMGTAHWALTQAQNVLHAQGACCCGLPCSRSGQR
jgi:hypothetical protein